MADRRNYQTFGLLDIGTSKTVAAVIVAEFVPGAAAPSMRLAGLGLQRSKGVKAGVLTDLDDAEVGCARGDRPSGTGCRDFSRHALPFRLHAGASGRCIARRGPMSRPVM